MVIGILYSEAGCGKTKGASTFEEPIRHLDLENRVADYEYDGNNFPIKVKKHKTYKNDVETRLFELVPLKRYLKGFQEDNVGSFKAFEAECEKLVTKKKEDLPATVIIDGIGDLRDYAHEVWCKEKNRKKAVNPGDWEQINDMVRDCLFPLINWARVNNITLIMTSQMKDNYDIVERDGKKESAKAGRIASHKEWCSYNVDFLVELWQPKGKDGKIIPGCYKATCSKSEVGSWEEEITGRNLYDVFCDKGMM